MGFRGWRADAVGPVVDVAASDFIERAGRRWFVVLTDDVLKRVASFGRILHDHPQFAASVLTIARERYDLDLRADALVTGRRR